MVKTNQFNLSLAFAIINARVNRTIAVAVHSLKVGFVKSWHISKYNTG